MDQHISVLGFLLSATVFSVGFLSARIHASYDTCEMEINGQSWRIRDALLRRERMSPANVQGSLTVLRRSRDAVALVTRAINGLLFVATASLAVDAAVLLRRGAPAPEHAPLLIGLVFAGSLAVTVIGEFDVRKVTRDQRIMINNSLPGRINRLSQALAGHRFVDADERLLELHDSFPNWGLLVELQAFSMLRQGKPVDAFEKIKKLVAHSDDLYLSHTVATAAAMAQDDGLGALSLLRAIKVRAPQLPGIAELELAVSLFLGHLSTMLDERSTRVLPTRAFRRTWRFWRRRRADHTASLNIDAQSVPETAKLLRILVAWDSGGDLTTLVKFAAGAPLLTAVRAVLPIPGTTPTREMASNDPAGLETMGLIELASGNPREALRILERAVRLAPAASRLHWGVAVASQRIGWTTAAAAALDRAETLVTQAPIVPFTRGAFKDDPMPTPQDVSSAFRSRLTQVDHIQLAVLGIPPTVPSGHATVAEKFSSALIARAMGTAVKSRSNERLVTA